MYIGLVIIIPCTHGKDCEKMKRILVSLLALILVASTMGGCSVPGKSSSSAKSASSKANKDIVVGAICNDVRQEWFAEAIKGMDDARDKFGIKLKVVSSNSDLSKESNLVDEFINEKVDAITISANDPVASYTAVKRALDAGIKVVEWNGFINAKYTGKTFVGVDNTDLGTQTGSFVVNYIKNSMNGKAKVIVLSETKYINGIDRTKGFTDELKKSGITPVAEQQAEFKEDGLTVTESLLQAHPDANLIWAWNQGALLGAMAALENLKRTDIALTGTDMSIDIAKEMLKPDTFLKAVTTQQPYQLGYLAVENCINKAKGQTTPAQVLVPVQVYTSDNKTQLQKYLDDRKYLQ
jgi:ABC-type sugar transport system substrate-binding protein